jgi:UDP:flavonoid glycosyltransferase YjiC (YdhE family)
VLLVGEAVTLAHAARVATLARRLDPRRFEVSVAMAPVYDRLLGELPGRSRLTSISPRCFLRSLQRGAPPWNAETLRRYVREDLRLLARVGPDVVVGDMRLSLAVSARLAGVPYANLINAYWSPGARFPLVAPDHPITDRLGPTLAALVFRAIRRPALAAHARPLNRILAKHGLPHARDVRHAYCQGDMLLHPDAPELVPAEPPPGIEQRYLGPVAWSPSVHVAWRAALKPKRPLVYVSLGSSGPREALAAVLSGLSKLEAQVLVATAGRPHPDPIPSNARAFPFLPGDAVCREASLVVTNGGSPANYQALAAGTPVLAIPTNLDQLLASSWVSRAGAGAVLRTQSAGARRVERLATWLLTDPRPRQAALDAQTLLQRYDAGCRFSSALSSLSWATRAR